MEIQPVLFAEEIVIPEKEIKIEADSIQNFPDQKKYVLKNATVEYGEYTFTAPKTEYYQEKKQLKTFGHTTIKGKIGELSGYDAVYSLDSEVVTAANITYFDPVKKYYIEADKIHLYTKDKYFELENATLTNCNPEKPGWKAFFTYLNYYPESYAYGYNLVFYMHDVPGLYLPVFSMPTVTQRRTGFIKPEIIYKISDNPSKSIGFRLKTPFFWNIRQDNDLTITPDFIEKRGVGAGLEYNYAFREGMYGQLYLWQINESNADRRPIDEYLMKPGDNPNPVRNEVIFQHRQSVFNQDTFFLKYRKLSDNEVPSEYFESLQALEYADETVAQYIYPWTNGYLSVNYRKHSSFLYQSIYNTDTNYKYALTIQPQIVVTHNIYDFPITFSRSQLTNQWTNFGRIIGWNGQRNIFSPGIYINDTFNFLETSLSYTEYIFNYDVNYKNENKTGTAPGDEKNKSFGYALSVVDISLGVEFYRPFLNISGISQGELTVKPSVSFHYTQDKNQRKSLSAAPGTQLKNLNSDYFLYGGMFDGYDMIFGYSTLTPRLDIAYISKVNKTHRKIWQLSVYEIYDLWRKNNEQETQAFFSGPYIQEVYRENEYGNKRLPLRIETYFSPSSDYTFTTFSRYDRKKGEFLESNIRADIIGKYSSRLGVGYNSNKVSYKELNNALHSARETVLFNTTFRFLSYWKLTYNAQWNLNREYNYANPNLSERQMINSTVRLDKNDPCYDLFIEYSEAIKSQLTDNNVSREYIDRTVTFGLQILNT